VLLEQPGGTTSWVFVSTLHTYPHSAPRSRQPSIEQVVQRQRSEDLMLERPLATAATNAASIAEAATARVLVRAVLENQ